MENALNRVPPAPWWIRASAAALRRSPLGRYRAMEVLSRRPVAPFLMGMPASIGGSVFVCDLRDAVAREVCFAGFYEPQETLLVNTILQPGMTFVDVGANWGYFSLLAAQRVTRSGKVLALEPDPRIFAMLEENIRRNRLPQVEILAVAAADAPGELVLQGYDAEQDRNFGISKIASDGVDGGNTFTVRAARLDDVLKERGIGAVDLLKMDIEGAECFAIAGLRGALERGIVRRVLIELHPALLDQHGSSGQAIGDELRSAGYQGFTVDHSPAATRAAAYGRRRKGADLLRPLAPGERLDAWPHQLWLAPGVQA